jgi:UDP-N-acetylglucosamine--N-acetylmuramyl-(pentapeptide) pyrophosphoryl-undecaprenol N-acetylglucosamine transferase
MSSFIMAGGGTGGHIIPAIAVAKELRRRGHEPFFIGTKRGLEAKLIPQADLDIEWIEIGGLNRVSLAQRIKSVLQLPFSMLHVAAIIRSRKPKAVFSMGGYVAGPVVLAARIMSLPVVVMEPNAIPGMTNRRMGRHVARALINFPETARFFPEGRSELTGMPVRAEFFNLPPKPAGNTFTVLVTGGSQGSRTLNNAGRDSWPLFRAAGLPARFIHQTGTAQYEELARQFREAGVRGEVTPFINDMPAAFAAADVVVCRAGASTVSELAAAGKPSILVPFPFAADNHQQRNAEALAESGAARVILDNDMSGQRFFDEVTRLATSPDELREMAKKAREFAKPGAAERAADILEELAV